MSTADLARCVGRTFGILPSVVGALAVGELVHRSSRTVLWLVSVTAPSA